VTTPLIAIGLAAGLPAPRYVAREPTGDRCEPASTLSESRAGEELGEIERGTPWPSTEEISSGAQHSQC
jgi:hypothetical protein